MVIKALESKNEEMTNFLKKLVNIDSGVDNPEGIAQVAGIIGDKLAEMSFSVEYLDCPGICTHLRAKRSGGGDKEVMIIGHMDTLFPKGTVAATRPFSD